MLNVNNNQALKIYNIAFLRLSFIFNMLITLSF